MAKKVEARCTVVVVDAVVVVLIAVIAVVDAFVK